MKIGLILNRRFVVSLMTMVAMIATVSSVAAEPQWNYHHTIKKADNSTVRGNLWLPPSSSQGVRGLIIGRQTVAEGGFMIDPKIRAAAADQQMGILYLYPGALEFSAGAERGYFDQMLDSLAAKSGFKEIKHAPFITMGHSAASYFAMSAAYIVPERTIGVIIYKGGIVLPDGGLASQLHNIPVLGVQGQFEEYADESNKDEADNTGIKNLHRDVLAIRALSPEKNLVSATCAVGDGHFFWSQSVADIVAMFIKKAARARIASIASDAPVALKPIDAKTGWLGSTELLTNPSAMRIDSFPSVADPKNRFWFFDKEHAQAWLDYQKTITRTRQSVANASNKPTGIGGLVWSGAIGDNAKSWIRGSIDAGSTVTIGASSSSGLAVSFESYPAPGVVSGNSVYVNTAAAADGKRVWIRAKNAGNSQYLPGDRCLNTNAKFRTGTAQTISFGGTIPTLQKGDTYTLAAKASTNLPVEYHIAAGPGSLQGNKLTVHDFASRSGKSSILLFVGQKGDGTNATATEAFEIPVNTNAVTVSVQKRGLPIGKANAAGIRFNRHGMGAGGMENFGGRLINPAGAAMSGKPASGMIIQVPQESR